TLHIVLLDDCSVRRVVVDDKRDELPGDPIGVLAVTIPAQAVDGDQLQRRPAERRVPWASGRRRARQDPAWRLEPGEVARDAARLVRRRQARPQWVERRRKFVRATLSDRNVVIEVEPGPLVPQVAIDQLPPPARPSL